MTVVETVTTQEEQALPSFVNQEVISRLGDLGLGEVEIGSFPEERLDTPGPEDLAQAFQQITDAIGARYSLIVRMHESEVRLFASPYSK